MSVTKSASVSSSWVVLGMAFMVAAGPRTAWAKATQVWFAPMAGTSDYLDLFSKPSDWSNAQRDVDVFKFYEQSLTLTDHSQFPVVLPDLQSVQAFSKLKSWGIAIGMEAGAVKSWGCTADVTASKAQTAIKNVSANGGTLTYIAMDEPYIGGATGCGYTMTQSAAQTASFISRVHASYPGITIGDIEPYPHFSVAQLEAWIDALNTNGADLPFFHLDVDRALAAAQGDDVAADLSALKSFCAARGIAFGVIFWGLPQDLSSDPSLVDQSYFNSVVAWIKTVAEAIGTPPHSIIQSWVKAPATGQAVPINLPENNSAIYSHTRLIDDYFSYFTPSQLSLKPGQKRYIDTGASLVFQGDGNLVLYGASGAALWESGPPYADCSSAGSDCQAVFQGDGNLVLYRSGQAYWATHTGGKGALLAFSSQKPYAQIFDKSNQVVWASSYSGEVSLSPMQLTAGQSIQITGTSGAADVQLAMQGDGNLVMSNKSTGAAVWATSSKVADSAGSMSGKPTEGMNCSGCSMAFQGDGNLVLYDSNGGAYWSSGTYGHSGSGALLHLMDKSPYVQITLNGSVIWQ